MNCPVDTNPKTVFGQAKPGISSIPPVALLHLGRGMDDGMEKYGLTNWREHEVSASVYYNAAFRHLAAWYDGEQVAPDSGVHHLGHVMACCAILLDAEHMGKLNDNRPEIPGPFARTVAELTRPMEMGIDRDETPAEIAVAEAALSEDICQAEDDYAEIVLRVLSTGNLEDAVAVIRSLMNGEWDEDETAQPEITVDEAKSVAKDFFARPPVASNERETRVAAVAELCNMHGANKIPELDPAGRAALVDMIEAWDAKEPEDFGEALGDPVDWDNWSEGPVEARMAVGFPRGEGTVVVEVKNDINHPDLAITIAAFLKGDQGSRNLAEFNNFRSHIGSFHHSRYDQANRTRLAFYLEARMAGVEASPTAMDDALQAAGVEIEAA